jgi:valyl-tRNA synthetase
MSSMQCYHTGMDKVWDHKKYEDNIYNVWEKSGSFTPKIDHKKKPFSIILPLPNANDPMHMGHALFTIEDIMIRYHRMLGDPTLWLPGGDHAGIETQYVFEKELAKSGKSRFDFDRETLYKMIWNFTEKNKNINKDQMKRLGFSMDWTRYHYSLEPKIVAKVLETFEKLHKDGLVYRGERIVNYCTNCGTAFSELEVKYKEKRDYLYTLDYGLVKIATTRPETIFADVAVAVNPKDKRFKNLLGKKAVIPIINIEIPIIADSAIDMNFGTGALKVTPSHDATDFEIGQKNNLEVISTFNRNGFIEKHPRVPKNIWGLSIKDARIKTIELLEKSKYLLEKEDLTHAVGACYRCGSIIEPMIMPQWFIKTKPLVKPAIEAVKKGKTKIFPKKRFEKMYFDWMENIKDWNISRQIVWGPRIPVWYSIEENPNLEVIFIDKKGFRKAGNLQEILTSNRGKDYTFNEIEKGLQQLIVPEPSKHILSNDKPGKNYLQDTDTFDTWFLSGQWPVNTLKLNRGDLEYFYPTSVLDTLWDILFFWVGRMMMFGLYLTGKVPFKTVHLHARVVDKFGKKMSKSRGNVVDPINMVEKYGADALRLALVIGVAPAGDIAISDEKVESMRNFANKLWNISRFILIKSEEAGIKNIASLPYSTNLMGLTNEDNLIIKKLENLIKLTTSGMEKFRFGLVTENLYQFIWHELADKYIESTKERLAKNDKTPLIVLCYVLSNCLKLLHPFMPFVTEAIWSMSFAKNKNDLLINTSWPKHN